MTRRTYLTVLTLSALAVLGPGSHAAAEERSFRLAGEGSLLFDPQQTLEGDFAAAGEATHLGHWTNTGTIAFDPIDPVTLVASGDVTFVAANGDELWMEFDGVLDLTTGLGTGTFVIVGGTGRFAGATGLTDLEIIQAPDGRFAFTLDGTIDY